MVDVGAGAGFPGHRDEDLQARVGADPDGTHGKRVEFLKYACGQLGLTGVEFRQGAR